MSTSKIEWCEHVWNPIVGCSVHSPGCTHCYAMRQAHRLASNPATPHYAGTTKMTKAGPVFTGNVAIASDATLLAPLRRKAPTTYFVNSMGDLFHPSVPDTAIDKVFAVMALCPQHTFQVLTKRAERMRGYLTFARSRLGSEVLGAYEHIYNAMGALGREGLTEPHPYRFTYPYGMPWPLPNVWLGTSAERQQEADERIPHLLATPAAVRFVSCEPLLGPIDLTCITVGNDSQMNALDPDTWEEVWRQWRVSTGDEAEARASFLEWFSVAEIPTGKMHPRLDWVIAGGESGSKARPMSIQWARELRDQCHAAGTAFFFKQWGEWRPAGARASGDPGRFAFGDYEHDRGAMMQVDGYPRQFTKLGARTVLERVGKKRAGRLLDGVEHNGMPVIASAQRSITDDESHRSQAGVAQS